MGLRQRREAAGTSILLVGLLAAAGFLLAILGAVGAGYVAHAELQQAADVAASAIELAAGDAPRERAIALARANGARRVELQALDDRTRIRVTVTGLGPLAFGERQRISAHAFAIVPSSAADDARPNPPGLYAGPLELVDGVPVCPAVAAAYRTMEARAARDGIALVATSGFRGWGEQAALYARLGPGLAAPPGASRHHDATELDIAVGPAGSPVHRWLQAYAPSHGFIQRYSWEPWHWGHVRGC